MEGLYSQEAGQAGRMENGVMTRDLDKRARRPLSYAEATDRGTCEGRQASPSNPNLDANRVSQAELTEKIIFRCTALDKAHLDALAQSSGCSKSVLLRDALGLVKAKRLRPIPKADPALTRQIAGIGNNLNQIAHRLNRDAAMGVMLPMDALALAAELVTIERQLAEVLEKQSEQC